VKPWERFAGRPYTPKLPAPEHGIKMKQAGVTWWGLRWIEALERVLRGDAGRLARGKSYARAGRAHDLIVERGTVRAQVTGTRPTPYEVTIELRQLSDEVWRAAIASLAAQARFAAELLAGQMPQQIDEAFQASGGSLFPLERAELSTRCSCPDWGDPCKHVAATHYLLGEALDRDPFLLFELRGRDKARVLDGLRAARRGAGGPEVASDLRGASPDPEVASVTLGPMTPADYDRLREPLPSLELSFEAPSRPGALLRQLGVLPGWRDASSPAEALEPLVQSAAAAARRLALGEPVLVEPAAIEPKPRRAAKKTARAAQPATVTTRTRSAQQAPSKKVAVEKKARAPARKPRA
jgi:uncharacterized Zn finger protein